MTSLELTLLYLLAAVLGVVGCRFLKLPPMLGYLVVGNSPLKSVSEIDQSGIRVGVSQGSSSQGVLTQTFKQAKVVPADSLAKAQAMLNAQQIDAFATNKGILFEMSDTLPGSRVMEGRWGLENLAIAVIGWRGQQLG